MARITSKYQVTIPKRIAEEFGVEPGDDVEFLPAGDAIRVVVKRLERPRDAERRLAIFDAATERQRQRQASSPRTAASAERGWRREDLYDRHAG